jgi:hypothetical protein
MTPVRQGQDRPISWLEAWILSTPEPTPREKQAILAACLFTLALLALFA